MASLVKFIWGAKKLRKPEKIAFFWKNPNKSGENELIILTQIGLVVVLLYSTLMVSGSNPTLVDLNLP